MMQIVHYVYSDASRTNPAYVAYIDFVLTALQHAGAHVIEEEQFYKLAYEERQVSPDDKVVGFFMSDQNSHLMYRTVKPENRWVHVIDERVTESGVAYPNRIEYCKQHDVKRMVVTYQNSDHLKQLNAAGIDYVVMPCCAARHRPRVAKPHSMCGAGMFHPTTYPTRSRLKTLLDPLFPMPSGLPAGYGHDYYKVLDTFQMGIVCKAGYRDRMVAKYVEYGACHVLPVGDCPSYMPEEMKRLMVNVDGMTDEQVVNEIKRLLATPDELFARQEAYSQAVHDNYDLLTNARRVLQTIYFS